MSSQKNIQDELKSLGSSFPFNNNQPFSVPEGYFEGLPSAILAKVKGSAASVEAELGELSPLLAGIPKVTPYSVPFSYFEENADGVQSITQEYKSDVLQSIGKEIPFAVPAGYFDLLPQQVIATVSRPKAKVVPFFARTLTRAASAAVVAAALFFGGYQLFFKKSDAETPVAISPGTDTTQTQLAKNDEPVAKEIKQASTQELEEFIENVQLIPANGQEKNNDDKQEAEDLLKDVTVSEMESFLSSIPTGDDDLLITD